MRLSPIVAVVLALAAPAVARADVRSGSVDDPREDTSHSLESQPDDISFVSASYDSDAGTLTLSARYYGTDSFTFYFDGFAPANLTPAIATKAMQGALVTRFGKAFSKAKPRFVACPQEQFTTIDELPSVLCAAEFRSGRTWRYVAGTVV